MGWESFAVPSAEPAGAPDRGQPAAVLGRTIDGLVVAWSALGDDCAHSDGALDRLLLLADLGLSAVVVGASDRALTTIAAAPRSSPRVWATDGVGRRWASDGSRFRPMWDPPCEAAAWASELLCARGITGCLAAYLAVDPRGHSPRSTYISNPDEGTVAAVLDEQVARRLAGRVPSIDEDPCWTVVIDDSDGCERELVHVRESLLTIGDGRFGTRGVLEDDGEGEALVVAAGVYDDLAGNPSLLRGPLWTSLVTLRAPGSRERRVLDLRSGVLIRERLADGRSMRTARFMSVARPGTAALRAEGPPAWLAAGRTLHLPGQVPHGEEGTDGTRAWAATRGRHGSGITAAAETAVGRAGSMRTVERLAVYAAAPRHAPTPQQVLADLDDMRAIGFNGLLAEQREALARRWADADVAIEGDDELTVAMRLAVFHLMTSVPSTGQAAVGARGLSGGAYGGHVLWDADVYVLPAMAATWAPSARAMLEYRVRRLAAARRIARAHGYRGARFPWESGEDGSDITPHLVRRSGQILPIHTGQHEEHIVADVAWAASHYLAWTGDRGFLDGPGRRLLTDTARYWASRIRTDREGRGHIYGVVGPDEYHEIVDDNAYTNVMARWSLRRAAELVDADARAGSRAEAARWRELASALVDGFDASTQLYEQCAGFFDLEPLIVSDEFALPIMADERLGRDRVRRAQVLKQADTLMLHHLVPEEVEPGSLAANLDFYGPRTAHGSSLSPAVHASLLARAGRLDAAVELFRMACRLDLDDLTGTSARGLHTATAGGVWQALVWGFAGIRPSGDALVVDPHLPPTWEAISVTVRFRGSRLKFRVDHDGVHIDADGPAILQLPDRSVRRVEPAGTYIRTRA
jgi:trehalose/maltose hydrolase-like predicted phosphorylase